MRFPSSLLVTLVVVLVGQAALAQERSAQQKNAVTFGLGTPAAAADIRELDISVSPDGKELPPGRGTAKDGAFVYSQRRCPSCHGPTGKEGPGPVLVMEKGAKPPRSSAYFPPNFWPFAPPLWDFIRRAMPFDQPGWLSPDEVYALTAFILHRNGIIEEADVMDATSLPLVRMPNRSAYDPAQADWKPGTPRGFVIKHE
jgi:cytochrome c